MIVFAMMSDHAPQRFLVNWNFTIGFVRSTVCLSVLDKGMLNQTSLAKRQYPDLLIRWLFRLLYEQHLSIFDKRQRRFYCTKLLKIHLLNQTRKIACICIECGKMHFVDLFAFIIIHYLFPILHICTYCILI